MDDIFKLRNADRLTREKHKLNLEIPKPNHATFGAKSLIRSYSPKIWNGLPYHIKTSENLKSFNAIIKYWDGNQSTSRVSNIRPQDNTLSQKQKYLILMILNT